MVNMNGAALNNIAWRKVDIAVSIVGGALAIAYAKLAWDVSSRNALLRSKLERHTKQLDDAKKRRRE